MRTQKQYLQDLEDQRAQERRSNLMILICGVFILGCAVYYTWFR